jgi:Type IV secretion-system coupling protein DNA-binding domain
MKQPPIEPPKNLNELSEWWNDWVEFVRFQPSAYDDDPLTGEKLFWGEHLFIGAETHNQLFRSQRAIGVQSSEHSDVLEYQDKNDLRAWKSTKLEPLLLHEKILHEHCYIMGPSGAGKSSLGIMSLLIQIMRGAQTDKDQVPPPEPVIVLDLKGDPALFHTVRIQAEERGQEFLFFSTEAKAPTYRFNPFRGFDRASRSVAQLCNLILDALNLNHGKGYGRSYYTERSRNVLSRTLKRKPLIQSFDELHAELQETVRRSDVRTKGDAFELLSVIEMLTEYRQLITNAEETISNTDGIIFIPEVLKKRQVAYFWLPAALESISVGEIAKLVIFNLRVAAQDWKRAHPRHPRGVTLVIDELQRVAGENLQGILQDARSFGIHTILANQSLSDLKSPTGFDLGPTIMMNTRAKFFFVSPSERDCYVYVERGKGFTEAKQYPQRGNPWLKELGPEEFAYHVRMGWPLTLAEYRKREAMPLPSWDEIPGGNFYEPTRATSIQEEADTPTSDILPRDFKLIQDEEWERQVAAIEAILPESEELAAQLEIFDAAVVNSDDVEEMRQGILASIADRGPDRSRCIINLLFDNHVGGVVRVPTWRHLWDACWKEPIEERRGADVEPANTVRQAVYRTREIMDRYFKSDAGRHWSYRAVIESNEYRLRFEANNRESDPPLTETKN